MCYTLNIYNNRVIVMKRKYVIIVLLIILYLCCAISMFYDNNDTDTGDFAIINDHNDYFKEEILKKYFDMIFPNQENIKYWKI